MRACRTALATSMLGAAVAKVAGAPFHIPKGAMRMKAPTVNLRGLPNLGTPCRCFPGYERMKQAWQVQAWVTSDLMVAGKTSSLDAVVADVNERFHAAKAPYGDGIEGSGVCLHLVDTRDVHNNAKTLNESASKPWWLACNATVPRIDERQPACDAGAASHSLLKPWAPPLLPSYNMHHRSCAMMNTAHPDVWADGQTAWGFGFLVSPATRAKCAFAMDGASASFFNPCNFTANQRHKDQQFTQVGSALLRHEEMRRNSDPRIWKMPSFHNEVVLDGEVFLSSLPWIIQAIVVLDCEANFARNVSQCGGAYQGDWQPRLNPGAEKRRDITQRALGFASRYHAQFVKVFPWMANLVPLLMYNGAGFEQVSAVSHSPKVHRRLARANQ